ncbi:fimbrial biogenesis outer membrane usher protein [Aquincola sp. S2]|uniref:Fimbrial biogenesis outer membrane usher protein n=1 Tax=Pseudaquabacterium terrae TaxID=2732868 RepID=A0ABX2EGT7_9BURK|nr:fimbria/pilus outer membrane usher protein [Aquabacterium terrae]NRF67827.1 fimbrial biogenesis outer membrane usher protein [Aquabacterium terrae]
MLRRLLASARRRIRSAALALVAAACLAAPGTAAAEALWLEVLLNGNPTQLIAEFDRSPDDRMSAKREELQAFGLEIPYAGPLDELIALDRLEGLSYQYDAPSQRISIVAPEALQAVKLYEASAQAAVALHGQKSSGMVLNYCLFAGAAGKALNATSMRRPDASLALDARVFSPVGTLSQSAIVRTSSVKRLEATRLDTTFTVTNEETLTTYRAGDTIAGGLAWTRPIRIGGLQMQRNFAVRPDLVTLPLPSFAGSAAVPSTAEIFVNNTSMFSQDLAPGPYRINNVPVVAGAGVASVVLRDAAGRETVTSQPFYVSPRLLAPGLTDFSVEVGVPRRSFGSAGDSYSRTPVFSASVRRGISPWLTLEGHAEGGAGLVNGGVGASVLLGSKGAASAAVIGSRRHGESGSQAFVHVEAAPWGMPVSASSQRTFGAYADLASATARVQPGTPTPTFMPTFDARPNKKLDRLNLSLPSRWLDGKSSLGMTLVSQQTSTGHASKTASASWSRPLWGGVSLFAAASATTGARKGVSLFAGLSIPFDRMSTTTAVSSGPSGKSASIEMTQPLGETPGSTGWGIRASEGSSRFQAATVSHRLPFARVEANVTRDQGGVRATAQIDGAVATLGDGVLFANRIDDAFAVVDAELPGVTVSYENRPMGKTGASGKLLVPALRSHAKNTLSIDIDNLPVDTTVDALTTVVAPRHRAGVLVKFPVQVRTDTAVLVLHAPDGAPLPVGAQGRIEQGEPFVVGYDGRAFVKGLRERNTAIVETAGRSCRASFGFAPVSGEQVLISPVVCH